MSITLTGQSMIRTDIRAHSPAAVPVIQSLLKGDVIFTNFETTIFDPRKDEAYRRTLRLAAGGDGSAEDVQFAYIFGQQSFVRSEDGWSPERAGAIDPLEHGPRRRRENDRRSSGAGLPEDAEEEQLALIAATLGTVPDGETQRLRGRAWTNCM